MGVGFLAQPSSTHVFIHAATCCEACQLDGGNQREAYRFAFAPRSTNEPHAKPTMKPSSPDLPDGRLRNKPGLRAGRIWQERCHKAGSPTPGRRPPPLETAHPGSCFAASDICRSHVETCARPSVNHLCHTKSALPNCPERSHPKQSRRDPPKSQPLRFTNKKNTFLKRLKFCKLGMADANDCFTCTHLKTFSLPASGQHSYSCEWTWLAGKWTPCGVLVCTTHSDSTGSLRPPGTSGEKEA